MSAFFRLRLSDAISAMPYAAFRCAFSLRLLLIIYYAVSMPSIITLLYFRFFRYIIVDATFSPPIRVMCRRRHILPC